MTKILEELTNLLGTTQAVMSNMSLYTDWSCRSKGLTKRVRTAYTYYQLKELENAFQQNNYLSAQKLIELAYNLHLSKWQIKIWFQNRRMRYKKDYKHNKSSSSGEDINSSSSGNKSSSTKNPKMCYGGNCGHDLQRQMLSLSNSNHHSIYVLPNNSHSRPQEYSKINPLKIAIKGPQGAVELKSYTNTPFNIANEFSTTLSSLTPLDHEDTSLPSKASAAVPQDARAYFASFVPTDTSSEESFNTGDNY